ncbi:unnamed protein product [Linum tenue]|uniref:ABC transporter domain-containing protein n=1 Tax=Linum tenue TaxID=586396 RepID=A0AAV0LYR4_9ROSI|nr:unnamed protein product [Linum tenue]
MARSCRSRCLVWEDVTVTLANGKKEKKNKCLVSGLTGLAESHRIMAVMGPSGSGKSTFLDALAGRLSPQASMAGKVLLRGGSPPPLLCFQSYVTQEDVFLGTLTVKETLYFGARLRLPELTTAELDEAIDETLTKMGLEECADNTIGNWHLRGISGGERRRLSIAVEILAQPQVLCLDEATTGLDSAAAFFVVQALRNVARRDGKIVVCSIHQPTDDVFRLFDDLLLISAGEAVYFGDSQGAVKFFADSGFPCPTRRNPPDHFLRCITPEFDQVFAALKQTQRRNYVVSYLDIKQTAEIRATLVAKYKASIFPEIARKKIQELRRIGKQQQQQQRPKQCWWKQFCTLTHRSILNMSRDLGYYWLRIVFYSLVALSTGSLEFDIGTSSDSVIARGKVVAFIYGIMIFLSVSGLPFFLDEIKVFKGETLAGYYGEPAYVLSNFLSSLPFTIVISLSSGSIIYSLVKFHPGFSHLLYFCINLFFCISVSEASVFVTASLVSNPLPSMGAAIGVTMLNLMPSNVFRPLPELPKIFWRYPLSYISFAAWGTQGNLKNDMIGLEFDAVVPGEAKIKGEAILQDTYGIDLQYSKWWDVVALFCLLLCYRLLLVIALRCKQRISSPFRRIYPTSGR